MPGICASAQFRAALNVQPHSTPFQVWRHQSTYLFENGFYPNGFELWFRRPGKAQDVPDNPLQAGDLCTNNICVLSRGWHDLQMFLQGVQSRLEGRKRIANLVSDAGSQGPERGKLLLLFKQHLSAN